MEGQIIIDQLPFNININEWNKFQINQQEKIYEIFNYLNDKKIKKFYYTNNYCIVNIKPKNKIYDDLLTELKNKFNAKRGSCKNFILIKMND
jgi:uncharacterized protein with NRDE domain